MLHAEAGELDAFNQLTGNSLLITPHAQLVVAEVLSGVDIMIAVGQEIPETVGALANVLDVAPPPDLPRSMEDGEALFWEPRSGHLPRTVRVQRSEVDRRRHDRKYAEGELGEERSFYFRGPTGALNLRAQNLMIFLQIADGLDGETWLYHFKRHDYSRWFGEMIKDEDLAREAASIEDAGDQPIEQGRKAIRAAVEARYTLPGTAPTGSSAEAPPAA